jgi:hypothetical protein
MKKTIRAILLMLGLLAASLTSGQSSRQSVQAFSQGNGALDAPAALKPQSLEKDGTICYASARGNDLSGGLSWGTAKGSIMGCYDAMKAAGGTIFFTDGGVYSGVPVSACKKTDPPGCGIWLMGPHDPNYKKPPPGWRRARPTNFVGVGGSWFGPNSHTAPKVGVAAGGTADRNHPSIWLSAVNTLTFSNMVTFQSQRPVVLGEDSNHGRISTGTVAGITFTNVDPSVANVPGAGPGVDITGQSFWLWFRDCVFDGFYANPVTSNNRAAVLIDGTGNAGSGMIYVTDSNVNGGGIKYVPGTNPGSLVVRNLTLEGDFGHDVPPAVWMSGSGTSNGTTLLADNVAVADAGPSGAVAVQIDGGLADNATILSAMGAGRNGRNVQGPAVVISQFQSLNLGPSNDTVSPLRQGQSGFIFGHVVGQQDSARRSFAPAAVRFPNLARQRPSSWTATQFGGRTKYETGISAPDGTSNAARASNVGSNLQEAVFFLSGIQRLAVGDWFLGGAWLRSSTGNGYSQSNTRGLAFSIVGNGNSLVGRQNGAVNKGDGEWEWQWFAEQVVSAATPSADLRFGGTFDNQHGIEVYAPVLIRIPAGTISDNEVYELAVNLQSYPDTSSPGDVSMLRNQRLSIGGSTPFLAKLTHSCNADCVQKFPDAPGPNDLAATNLSQVWMKDQTFTARATFGEGTPLSRYARYQAVLNASEVAQNTCVSQSFKVVGIRSRDILIGISKPTEQAGLSVSAGHVTGNEAATLNFCNNTPSPILPKQGETYQFVVVQ